MKSDIRIQPSLNSQSMEFMMHYQRVRKGELSEMNTVHRRRLPPQE